MTEHPGETRLYGRREMLRVTGASLAGALVGSLPGCATRAEEPVWTRLAARPQAPSLPPPQAGLSRLSLDGDRDGLIYVPSSYAGASSSLLVLLHGAGGSGANWESFPARAEKRGLILLMPDSRGRTWDLILGRVGPDIEFLDRALEATFTRCNVDRDHVAIGGFSDGASYALTVGLARGDLFSRIVAYSPGFLRFPGQMIGKPRVFDSHGLDDRVLSIASSRDRIVPALRERGYQVTYRPFAGGHTVPGEIADESLDWLGGDP